MYICVIPIDIWKEDANSCKIIQDFVTTQVNCMFKHHMQLPCTIGGGVLFDHKKVTDNELKKMVKNKILCKKAKNRYYTNSNQLGELLMEIMLQEVYEFCKIDIQQNWTAYPHQQVITLLIKNRLQSFYMLKINCCYIIKYSHLLRI